MKKKKIIIELLLFSALTFLFVGCTGKSDLLQVEETETPAEPSQDPFMLKSVYGTSPENDSYVVDYEESTEYTDSGKPDLFVGRGRLTDRDEEENMLKINFIYREDGTLFCR